LFHRFHVELIKKANPNLVIAGMASLTKIISKPTRIATITNAKKKVRLEKILSLNSERRLSFQLFTFLDVALFPGLASLPRSLSIPFQKLTEGKRWKNCSYLFENSRYLSIYYVLPHSLRETELQVMPT